VVKDEVSLNECENGWDSHDVELFEVWKVEPLDNLGEDFRRKHVKEFVDAREVSVDGTDDEFLGLVGEVCVFCGVRKVGVVEVRGATTISTAQLVTVRSRTNVFFGVHVECVDFGLDFNRHFGQNRVVEFHVHVWLLAVVFERGREVLFIHSQKSISIL